MKSKSGIMVVFEGTDGSGKTTVINGLKEYNTDLFNGECVYYHWRPGFIKKEGRSGGAVTEPHAKPAYGTLKSFAKFMFFNIDYVIGYFFNVKQELKNNRMVVFDRYYYDYYMDKLRYRLKISNRTLDIFLRIIPKPDATFLLLADPDVLYQRKKEMSLAEIQRQCNALRIMEDKVHNAWIIDVNEPANTVIKKVADIIREVYEKKMVK